MSTFLLSSIAFAQSPILTPTPKPTLTPPTTSRPSTPRPATNKEEVIDTDYYKNSFIEIAEGVNIEKHQAVNPKSEFFLKNGKVEVYFILKSDKPFKTKMLSVDVYDEDEDPYDSFELDLPESWNFASFHTDFDKKGHYYLDIYNSDGVFINSAEVDIK